MKLVLWALLGGLAVGAGCSHEARPVAAPAERPPLPPASGSPIAHLVEDAAELELRDDQLAALQQIDEQLGAKLAEHETELRSWEPVPPAHSDAPRGLGFHAGAGAATVDEHGLPMGSFPAHGGARGFADGEQPRQLVIRGETIDRVHRDRDRDTRDAIRRALAVLDAAQRVIARRVLHDHGVDPDTGETTSGPPGAQPPRDDLTPIRQAEP
jgi:hypothetical protein